MRGVKLKTYGIASYTPQKVLPCLDLYTPQSRMAQRVSRIFHPPLDIGGLFDPFLPDFCGADVLTPSLEWTFRCGKTPNQRKARGFRSKKTGGLFLVTIVTHLAAVVKPFLNFL